MATWKRFFGTRNFVPICFWLVFFRKNLSSIVCFFQVFLTVHFARKFFNLISIKLLLWSSSSSPKSPKTIWDYTSFSNFFRGWIFPFRLKDPVNWDPVNARLARRALQNFLPRLEYIDSTLISRKLFLIFTRTFSHIFKDGSNFSR